MLLTRRPLDRVAQHLSRYGQRLLRGPIFRFHGFLLGSYLSQVRHRGQPFPCLDQGIQDGPWWRHTFEGTQCLQVENCGLPRRRVVQIGVTRMLEKARFRWRFVLGGRKSEWPARRYSINQNDRLGTSGHISLNTASSGCSCDRGTKADAEGATRRCA